MAQIASELLIDRLADWEVDTVFGLPGDGINGIMEGPRRHSDRVRFFLIHHEEAAAFMATAYAKATGKLGVCLPTRPGRAAGWCCGRTPSPTTSARRSARRPPRSWRRPGMRSSCPPGRCAAA
jgi:hypothetical protein